MGGWIFYVNNIIKYVLHYIVIVIVQLTVYTLLGTNISDQKSLLKMIFLFPFGGICIRSLEGTSYSIVKNINFKSLYIPPEKI